MEGGGIPVTEEEMNELMYKPLPGEWGQTSRDAECERIVGGIDQLITVGVYARTGSRSHTSAVTSPVPIHSQQPIDWFL